MFHFGKLIKQSLLLSAFWELAVEKLEVLDIVVCLKSI